MKFYDLNSIIAAQKQPIAPRQDTESFGVVRELPEPYIQPTFEKIEFGREKPTIILVSAVGATGKTTLARVLSNSTSLPLLDLAKHKPVGDNSMTGLLTSAFHVKDLTNVFQRIGEGAFGLIVDGIDEGRSKTTEKAFEAFLDDIVRLCKGGPNVSFVLLGRTQVLEDCWIYLTDQGVETGLVAIRPFDIEQARTYVDVSTKALGSAHATEYVDVRDMILERLGAAFTDSTAEGSQSFLSFIGYPPVLDAIVTLLQEEKNYHRLLGELRGGDADGVEVSLLYRIAAYILQREKEEKVVPNILSALIKDLPQNDQREIKASVYGDEEQCMRLVAHSLGRWVDLCPVGKTSIDEKYQDGLRSFLQEHPFVNSPDRQFRNAVFEAVALSTLILSTDSRATGLALEYIDTHKNNYHLIYLLHKMARGREIPIDVLRAIIGSALEFRSRTSSVQIRVGDPSAGDWESDPAQVLQIEIEVFMGSDNGPSKRFLFISTVSDVDSVNLGHRLSATYVFLPCEVRMSGAQELELTAPTVIFGRKISLLSQSLVLRAPSTSPDERQVVLAAEALECTLGNIVTNGADLILGVTDPTGITYPTIQYVEAEVDFSYDPSLREKYLRLRRILVLFRSHSRGALAKYRAKIEHERVLRNPLGRAILQQILDDEILTREGDFYFLQPENVHRHLGVSWIDLRKGRTSDKLMQYLRSIN
jgi:hypothetical protein